MKLFDRSYSLTVGTLEVSALAFAFEVKKTLKPEPNTCDIQIRNLNPAHRSILEESPNNVVRLEVGYGGENHQIFLGEVFSAWTSIEGPDKVTQMANHDGAKKIGSSRINVSYGKGTPPDVALRALVKALGVKAGNVEKAVTTLRTKGLDRLFASGTVISGAASREMTDFCRSAGLEWSIQDGQVQILDRDKALEGKAVLLTPSTGLIGSPSVDSKEIVTAQAMMIPELRPGVAVVIKSAGFEGAYRVQECVWKGDTHGQDWGVTITCKRYASTGLAVALATYG